MLFAALAFAGCTKDDENNGPDNGYYFKAKVNGQQYDFLHDAIFQGGGNDNKMQHVGVYGYAAKPIEQSPHGFGFDLWNEGGDFLPGTYTQNGGAGGGIDYEDPESYSVDMEYHIQTADHGTVQYDARETGDFTLKILEISRSGGIKGTFEGVITNENDFSDQMEITEGEFYLPHEEIVNP